MTWPMLTDRDRSQMDREYVVPDLFEFLLSFSTLTRRQFKQFKQFSQYSGIQFPAVGSYSAVVFITTIQLLYLFIPLEIGNSIS